MSLYVMAISIRAVDEKEACGILQLQLGGASKPLLAFFMRYFWTFSQKSINSTQFVAPMQADMYLKGATAAVAECPVWATSCSPTPGWSTGAPRSSSSSSSSLSLYSPSSCQSHVVLTTVSQVPFLSAAVWRDGETLEDELMEAVMTDKVILILALVVDNHLRLSRLLLKSWRLMPDLGSTWRSLLRPTLGRDRAKGQEEPLLGRREMAL